MVRKIVAGLVAVAAALVVMNATAADTKKLTVHDIMEKVPGKKGCCAVTAGAAAAEKWDDAAKTAKELKMYGDAMVKTDKPDKGSKESWTKLTKIFSDDINAIVAGVEKKDTLPTPWRSSARAARNATTPTRNEP
jgi:hypothetical protein